MGRCMLEPDRDTSYRAEELVGFDFLPSIHEHDPTLIADILECCPGRPFECTACGTRWDATGKVVADGEEGTER